MNDEGKQSWLMADGKTRNHYPFILSLSKDGTEFKIVRSWFDKLTIATNGNSQY